MARKILLACGIASSLLYVAATLVGALVWPEYRTISQTVSELSAVDAPSRPIVAPLFFGYGALALAFGFGVWASAGARRALRAAGALLIGYGAVCLTGPFTPMHLRGIAPGLSDTLHIVSTAIDVLFILLIIGFTAAALRGWFRLYSIATVVVLLVFGILAGLDGPRLAANQPTPWFGVTERFNIFGFLLWVVVLAIDLWEPRRQMASIWQSSKREVTMRKRMTVEDLMSTAVIALRATDTVGRLREEMELAEIRHIPVVDAGNRVIGIVSNRDLHRAAGSRTVQRVADVMTHPVRTVQPSTPAAEAATLMIELKIGSLPVVGEDQQLVGVITETDFLAVAQQALAGLPLDRARA